MPAPEIEAIETTLRLNQALQLARRGRLREAESIVVPGGGAPRTPLELHALAALATGAGDYNRALPIWRQLAQAEPGHAEARRMIAAIELWQIRPSWYGFLLPGAGVLGLIVLVVVLLRVL